MPHASNGDDLAPSDEIKVFTLEGEGDEEKRSSAENLNDLKCSLVTEGEDKNVPPQGFTATKNSESSRTDHLTALPGKSYDYLHTALPFGYVMPPYHHHPNGALGPMSVVNKVPIMSPNHAASPLSLMMYSSEAFQPPPAHMGISPVHIDPKTGESSSQAQMLLSKHFYLGMPRPPMYPLPSPNQYHHPVFSPDFSQQFQWHPGSMYSMAPAFRGSPYPGTVPISHNNLPKFSPPSLIHPHPGMPPHPNVSHHLVESGPKLESSENIENRHLKESQERTSGRDVQNQRERKKPHIKKPLNAFMLYMKDMRSKVVAECTLKESAAINQILGKRWRSLSGEEQAPYYALAEKERDLHKQRYPGWSARDNYAQNTKKKKRKRDKLQEGDGNNPKKCRARFGLDQQSRWCKPCRRKKKCIRYLNGSENAGESEDNIGSVESIGSVEAPTPDSRCDGSYGLSDNETEDSDSDNQINASSELSMSSPPIPGGLGIHSMANSKLSLGSPPCNHHPLSIQHLSQPSCGVPDSPDPNPISIPELPTPPSTDSSTATAPPLLTVT